MSATKISWTDLTLNPVIGCTHAAYQQEDGRKVGHPGCQNCYAEVMCSRTLPGFEVHNECSQGGRWTGRVEVIHDRLLWPFTRKEYRPRPDGTKRRCFLTSLGDMGHPSLKVRDWMAIQGMMLLAPWIIWQDLTKRPIVQENRLKQYSPMECVAAWREVVGQDMARQYVQFEEPEEWHLLGRKWHHFTHIHRYVSVSDQPTVDALIPDLLEMPAAVRGVSLEPMLGPVDLGRWLKPRQSPNPDGYGGDIPVGWTTDFRRVNHVIIGGESGRGARPFALEWALDIIDQCRKAKVPCFVKQLGSNPYTEDVTQWEWFDAGMPIRLSGKGEDMREWPECLRVRQHVGDKS